MEIQSSEEDEDDIYTSTGKSRPKKADKTTKRSSLKKYRTAQTLLSKKKWRHKEEKIQTS